MIPMTTILIASQMMKNDADKKRGTDYADGGVSDLNVHYPDPDKVKQFHDEWEGITGYWKDEDDQE